MDTNLFDHLFELLEKTTLKKKSYKNNNNRQGFDDHRGGLYGKVKPRYRTGTKLSKDSRDHPEVFNEIFRIGQLICPIPFTTVQLNKDLVCAPHKDNQNIGESCLVSFGTYTGGNIVIEGEELDARLNPIVFNGSKPLHWNTPILSRRKYSLVFFNI